MITLVDISCATCGIKKPVRPIDIARGKAKYCSKACAGNAKRVPKRRCLHCGAEVKRNSRQFCSLECGGMARQVDTETRFWSYVSKTESCWEWTGAIANNGYGVINRPEGLITTHRLSYQIHIGPIPEGLLVLHKCNNRPCVRPDHLYAGTHADNMHDMSEDERTGIAKLSWEDRLAVIDMASVGMSAREISERYGVTPQAIHYWTKKFESRPMRHGGKRA